MALPSFKRLNEIVSISIPGDRREPVARDLRSRRSDQPADPEVVLLLPWSDASLRNIEKYTMLYAQTFPQTSIVVVRTGVKDFFWRSERASRKLAEPVINLLAEKKDEQVLVHVMSNAGAKQWCTIDETLSASLGRGLTSFCTVLDSTPGRSHFLQTWAALRGSLPRPVIPRLVLGLILSFVLCIMHLQKALSLVPDLLEVIRARMNRIGGETSGRRCYIFSKNDEMVGYEDVEDHALEALEKGWQVRSVVFEHSAHVGHFKQDPVRYKNAVLDTWRGT